MIKYHTLQELVFGNGGITNVTFIVPMRPIRVCGPFAFTTSSDGEVPVEMQIEDQKDPDDLDSIHGHYKVRLIPADPNLRDVFSYERFYQMDLMQLIMNYTVGRMEGAYCMLGNRCADANIHATVRQVHAEFEAALLLTLR